LFDPIINDIFGECFEILGISHIDGGHTMTKLVNGRAVLKVQEVNLMFIATACVGGKFPSSRSNSNKSLHCMDGWSSHLTWRTKHNADGSVAKSCLLELCVKTPQVFFAAGDRMAHISAIQGMVHDGLVLPGHWLRLTLYNGCAIAFVRFMECSIICSAMNHANWDPIFVLKWALLQKAETYGTNEWRVACIALEKPTQKDIKFQKQLVEIFANLVQQACIDDPNFHKLCEFYCGIPHMLPHLIDGTCCTDIWYSTKSEPFHTHIDTNTVGPTFYFILEDSSEKDGGELTF
jgi:hypothetical protein